MSALPDVPPYRCYSSEVAAERINGALPPGSTRLATKSLLDAAARSGAWHTRLGRSIAWTDEQLGELIKSWQVNGEAGAEAKASPATKTTTSDPAAAMPYGNIRKLKSRPGSRYANAHA
ncbi:hypothetical protein [Nonomuraea sp. NPDC050310]|uniref:hypothetical protein n=1 Tax=Nonomuraea sp. NPDC050310 TaxID=3154935 RepID=UPI0033E34EF2